MVTRCSTSGSLELDLEIPSAGNKIYEELNLQNSCMQLIECDNRALHQNRFFFSGKELMPGFAFNSYGGNQSRMSTNQSLEQALPYVGRAVLTAIDVNLTTEGKIFKPR